MFVYIIVRIIIPESHCIFHVHLRKNPLGWLHWVAGIFYRNTLPKEKFFAKQDFACHRHAASKARSTRGFLNPTLIAFFTSFPKNKLSNDFIRNLQIRKENRQEKKQQLTVLPKRDLFVDAALLGMGAGKKAQFWTNLRTIAGCIPAGTGHCGRMPISTGWPTAIWERRDNCFAGQKACQFREYMPNGLNFQHSLFGFMAWDDLKGV